MQHYALSGGGSSRDGQASAVQVGGQWRRTPLGEVATPQGPPPRHLPGVNTAARRRLFEDENIATAQDPQPKLFAPGPRFPGVPTSQSFIPPPRPQVARSQTVMPRTASPGKFASSGQLYSPVPKVQVQVRGGPSVARLREAIESRVERGKGGSASPCPPAPVGLGASWRGFSTATPNREPVMSARAMATVGFRSMVSTSSSSASSSTRTPVATGVQSSLSPIQKHQPIPQPRQTDAVSRQGNTRSFELEPRSRRGSAGLVFNPGSSTVELSAGVKDEEGKTEEIADLIRGEEQLDAIPRQAMTDAELFAKYISADSGNLAVQLFAALMERFGKDSAVGEFPFQRIKRNCRDMHWKARSIWHQLSERTKEEAYIGAGSRAGFRVVVCGAGPCGLRAALELALLGMKVQVVEKRPASQAFSRINRVHLWEWCKQDLQKWGAKTFEPPGASFGSDNDFCHIGIGELQLLLLKSALLLGVSVRFAAEAKALSNGSLFCKDGSQVPCNALIIAGGASSPLAQTLGLRSVACELRGKGSAIGVVANFVNHREAGEMALRQFSWARQFNVKLFQDLEDDTHINLENVVYYKGQAQHYMVMTPVKRSLLEAGVLKNGQTAADRLLQKSNVDMERLSDMVRKVASFFGLPIEMCADQGAMIFDFSGVQRLECPAAIAGGIYICAVGDALLEPFWPEGLGIVRGFMSALDAASAVAMVANGKQNEAISLHSRTYNVLKSVAGQTAQQCLQKDSSRYTVQPASRYIFSK
eukprot:CAMPEP_0197636834 /NCGR_PEP_ID=MMETSP1338-20131121/12229_1 /TAXON_ID=43686 ORGANISM="Pelagodinium beii, Strain RCC1491" /NCGR_SAMPLE_ID=MMETSP1338 /ASSEMBLY_ACC=CAM_ASM_000754 /LENGTH=758 /DNA_ID=CAMNT_0043209147 /DNA_START=22 /DNA_END=2298 /DNA_ORIENTATION=-